MEQTVSTQSHVNLDASLAAYGRRARRPQRSKMEFLGYTAAAGGLAFAGGDAMGAIVHNTTSQGGSVTGGGFATSSFSIDIDGAGGNDWRLRFGFYDFGAIRYVSNKTAEFVGYLSSNFSS